MKRISVLLILLLLTVMTGCAEIPPTDKDQTGVSTDAITAAASVEKTATPVPTTTEVITTDEVVPMSTFTVKAPSGFELFGNEIIGYAAIPQGYMKFIDTSGISDVDPNIKQVVAPSGAWLLSLSRYDKMITTAHIKEVMAKQMAAPTYVVTNPTADTEMLVVTDEGIRGETWVVVYTQYKDKTYYMSFETYSTAGEEVAAKVIPSYIEIITHAITTDDWRTPLIELGEPDTAKVVPAVTVVEDAAKAVMVVTSNSRVPLGTIATWEKETDYLGSTVAAKYTMRINSVTDVTKEEMTKLNATLPTDDGSTKFVAADVTVTIENARVLKDAADIGEGVYFKSTFEPYFLGTATEQEWVIIGTLNARFDGALNDVLDKKISDEYIPEGKYSLQLKKGDEPISIRYTGRVIVPVYADQKSALRVELDANLPYEERTFELDLQ